MTLMTRSPAKRLAHGRDSISVDADVHVGSIGHKAPLKAGKSSTRTGAFPMTTSARPAPLTTAKPLGAAQVAACITAAKTATYAKTGNATIADQNIAAIAWKCLFGSKIATAMPLSWMNVFFKLALEKRRALNPGTSPAITPMTSEYTYVIFAPQKNMHPLTDYDIALCAIQALTTTALTPAGNAIRTSGLVRVGITTDSVLSVMPYVGPIALGLAGAGIGLLLVGKTMTAALIGLAAGGAAGGVLGYFAYQKYEADLGSAYQKVV